ncbi:ROK family protein [Microbacterium sp. NPDC076911]|uniref:ROK family transcriptional regulator n=1 Tax=Microbacterium sp. NPDC076911 TaxID=3154958 RepID=UPI00343E4FC8
MQGLDPRALRRFNTSAALRALAVAAGPVGMSELAEQTGLSRRTVELILTALVEAGWVSELDRVPLSGGAGRPPRRFELRADHSLLAAARVSTLDATVVVADVRGRILGRAHRLLPDYFDPQGTLDVVAELVHEALDDAGGSIEQLRAGAMAAGGAIDENGIIHRLVHAEAWVGMNLPAALNARVPVPWFADNDANLGALAERWRGNASDHENMVWSILGVRSGLGVLIRGSVHRGFQGAAGEIVEAQPLDAGLFNKRPVAFLTSPISEQREQAEEVYRRARAGDPDAEKEVDAFVEHVGDILTTLSWTIAPSLIVLGGGLERGADVLLPRVRDALRRAQAPEIELRTSTLGADGPLIGALRFVLDRMDTELFGPLVPDV